MSYGHGPELAAAGATRPLPPGLLERPDALSALVAHDIGALYKLLMAAGVSQRQIARHTGQSQSEVAEIRSGRQVGQYEVFERIALGLDIPRERMGLSWWGSDGVWYGPESDYPDDGAPAKVTPDQVDEMLRRHLIAFGPAAVLGGQIKGLGELPPLCAGETPAHLGHGDVIRGPGSDAAPG